MRDRNSRLVTVEDREAQMGDTAEIDFEGFVAALLLKAARAKIILLNLAQAHSFLALKSRLQVIRVKRNLM